MAAEPKIRITSQTHGSHFSKEVICARQYERATRHRSKEEYTQSTVAPRCNSTHPKVGSPIGVSHAPTVDHLAAHTPCGIWTEFPDSLRASAAIPTVASIPGRQQDELSSCARTLQNFRTFSSPSLSNPTGVKIDKVYWPCFGGTPLPCR
jgi:hypothetical protein